MHKLKKKAYSNFWLRWTQKQYKWWKIQPDRNIQTDQKLLLVFSLFCWTPIKTPPCYPTIVWLNFSQEHTGLPLICEETSSLLPIGWQDMSPLPPPKTRWLPQRCSPTTQKGAAKGKESDDGGKVGEEEWMKAEKLTHMWQDRAVLLMGREKYNKPQKGAIDSDVVVIKPPLGYLSGSWQAR